MSTYPTQGGPLQSPLVLSTLLHNNVVAFAAVLSILVFFGLARPADPPIDNEKPPDVTAPGHAGVPITGPIDSDPPAGVAPACDVPPLETGVGVTRVLRGFAPQGCVALVDAWKVTGIGDAGVFKAFEGPWRAELVVSDGAIVVVHTDVARDVFCNRLRYAINHGFATALREGLPGWAACW